MMHDFHFHINDRSKSADDKTSLIWTSEHFVPNCDCLQTLIRDFKSRQNHHTLYMSFFRKKGPKGTRENDSLRSFFFLEKGRQFVKHLKQDRSSHEHLKFFLSFIS
jgi:hypothetical protein